MTVEPPDQGAPPARPVLDFGALPPVGEGSALGAELSLALAALRSGAGEAFIGIVSVLSIVGVVVGVALLDAVVAVMTGFEVDLRDKILGANAHVVVMRFGGGMEVDDARLATIEGVDGVVHAAPFTYNEVMIRSRWGTSGIILKGIDAARTGAVTAVRDQLTTGLDGALETDASRQAVFLALDTPIPGRFQDDATLPPILIGSELADQLQVMPGDQVQVINPIGNGDRGVLGMPSPTFRNLRVLGVFHSGMFEYDTKWTYVGVPFAQDFFQTGETVAGVEIRVRDIDDVDRVARDLEAALGHPHYARHWRNMNQALFEALELEKVVMGLILGMIVVVAGLLIVSNLYMLVLTKRREIAILKAMGAGRGTIARVFVWVGAIIGVTGTVGGTLLGWLLCLGLERYEYPLETDVYYLSSLPVVIQPGAMAVVAVAALVICFLATLAPALRASGLHPVDGLRDE